MIVSKFRKTLQVVGLPARVIVRAGCWGLPTLTRLAAFFEESWVISW